MAASSITGSLFLHLGSRQKPNLLSQELKPPVVSQCLAHDGPLCIESCWKGRQVLMNPPGGSALSPAGRGQGGCPNCLYTSTPLPAQPRLRQPCATLHQQAKGAKGPHLPLTPDGPNTRESGAAGRSQTFKYTSLLPILYEKHFSLGKCSKC